jgi:GNAT superfamily N-acetyltransferase
MTVHSPAPFSANLTWCDDMPETDLQIRFATPDDAVTLYEFIQALAVYEREPDVVEATPESLRSQLEADPPPFECLIAERGGLPLGFALFFHNYSTWRGQQGLYLEDLFVLEAHRGQGIGKRLLATLAAMTSERGWSRLEWQVLDWNQPAIDFYAALGAPVRRGWLPCRLEGDPLVALGAEGVTVI